MSITNVKLESTNQSLMNLKNKEKYIQEEVKLVEKKIINLKTLYTRCIKEIYLEQKFGVIQ